MRVFRVSVLITSIFARRLRFRVRDPISWTCPWTMALLEFNTARRDAHGPVRLQCSLCNVKARTRLMYRCGQSIGRCVQLNGGFYFRGTLDFCSHCALLEATGFLPRTYEGIFRWGGADSRDKAVLIAAILRWTRGARGFAADCFKSMLPRVQLLPPGRRFLI